MTLFGMFSQSKNKFLALWNKRDNELRAEYAKKEDALLSELSRIESGIQERLLSLRIQERDVEDSELRVMDRKVELEKANTELKAQIRLIEAKASPDNVWCSAFSAGFTKAWDMMEPLMTEGVQKMKDSIRSHAIDETLDGLESTVAKRVEATGNAELVALNKVLAQKRDFEAKFTAERNEEVKRKYRNYIDCLNWVLNGNVLQKAE